MISHWNSSSVPSRIVVRGTNWVGDTVMSLPAVKELRRIFPSSRISFWLPSGLAPLIAASGVPDEIISFDPNSGGPVKRSLTMSKRLCAGRYDMAVLLQNAFESAFTSRLARIPRRSGYTTDLRGPLLNIKVPLTKEIRQKHQVFYYLGITDYLEEHFRGTPTRTGEPDCSIRISEESITAAANLLASEGIEGPFFCLCPGSVNSEAKRWPATNFAELADTLYNKLGTRIVFIGAPQERDLVEGIIRAMKTGVAVNMAGCGDMMVSMAIMNRSSLVISNDTGSAHMAVAAFGKVLTIFGPTIPGATAPYGPTAHIIEGRAPCAPCRYFRCPRPDHACMKSVAPQAVFQKIRDILCSVSEDGG
jgi:lipopolysaccharide heptosyltransferase II